MPTRARRSTNETAYGDYAAEAHDTHDELWPGERNGPLPPRKGGKALLRGVVILGALGGGWALLSEPANWPGWQSIATAVSSWMNSGVPAPAEPAALALATTAPQPRADPATRPAALDAPSLAAPNTSAMAPRASASSEAPPQTTAALPPPETDAEKPKVSPLPPPAADPADPYSIRAEAVGLHPDLSRVLLARLSPTDYRNAGVAVQTAVAETPDDAVLVWPRQRKPELALFKVRFVPGAAPGCRRYVVTITKDGWLTTALPMERCGSQLRRAQAKRVPPSRE